MTRAEELIHFNPMELLPEHQSLLVVDFEHLGEGPAEDHQYWNAEMESAIAAAGHITIDPLMLDRHPGDSTCGFPIEKPMPADFKLWNEAMHALSSQTLKLRHVLGDFIYRPHCVDKWFMNEDRSEFYYANSLNFYDI